MCEESWSSRLPELQLQIIVSCHLSGFRKWSWVLNKSNKSSKPRRPLSDLQKIILNRVVANSKIIIMGFSQVIRLDHHGHFRQVINYMDSLYYCSSFRWEFPLCGLCQGFTSSLCVFLHCVVFYTDYWIQHLPHTKRVVLLSTTLPCGRALISAFWLHISCFLTKMDFQMSNWLGFPQWLGHLFGDILKTRLVIHLYNINI